MLVESYPYFLLDHLGLPDLNGVEIDEYAQEEVAIFAPKCLNAPIPLDPRQYLRNRLGCRVQNRRLSMDQKYWGMSCFRSTAVDFFDNGYPIREQVKGGSVFLERGLLSSPALCRAALSHEAGHMFLHQQCFQSCSLENLDPLPSLQALQADPDLEKRNRKMEDQANRFGRGLLMNRKSFQDEFDKLIITARRNYGPKDTASQYYFLVASLAPLYSVPMAFVRNRMKDLYLTDSQGNLV